MLIDLVWNASEMSNNINTRIKMAVFGCLFLRDQRKTVAKTIPERHLVHRCLISYSQPHQFRISQKAYNKG